MKKEHMNLLILLGGVVVGNIATAQVTKIVDKDGTGGKLMKYLPGAAVASASVFGLTKIENPSLRFLVAGAGIGGGLNVVKQASADLKINVPGLSGVDEEPETRLYFNPEKSNEGIEVEMEYTPFEEVLNALPGFEQVQTMDDLDAPVLRLNPRTPVQISGFDEFDLL